MVKIPSPLFAGLSEDEYADMQRCGCLTEKRFTKGETVFRAGDTTRVLGVVVSGRVRIENINLWGGRSLLADAAPGQIFGETYAVTGEALLVDAIATEDSRILFMDAAGLSRGRYAAASWHGKVLNNLLLLAVGKNLGLSVRAFQTSFKKIRPRIEAYLSGIALRTGSREFDIPFDRQALADYLNVDRSALSKELARMRREGLITFRKNHFKLLGLS